MEISSYYCINNICETKSAKLLGVALDDRLNCSVHVNDVGKKLSCSLFIVRQLKK